MTDKQKYILSEMSKGRSLCFSQDGDMTWLHPGMPTEFLDQKWDADIRVVLDKRWAANDPDADHWTAANCYDITPAGLAMLTAA